MTLDFILRAAARSLDQGKRKPHCGNGGVRRAMQEIERLEWCSEYGEPGYDNPRKGIVFANWNVFPTELGDIMERAGYSLEWSDEWIISHETDRAYRTAPDSYEWKPYIRIMM